MLLSRRRALIEGLVTVLLWASSFVIVKVGLAHVSPAALAGLRYFGGFLILFPALWLGSRTSSPAFVHYDRGVWLRLLAMGLAAYPLANGLLFWALRYLSPTVGAFSTSLSPFLVLALGALFLREWPTRRQFLGLAVMTLGSAVFFAVRWQAEEWWALGALGLSTLGFAVFSILGRDFARARQVDPLSLTVFPLGLGGGALLLGVLAFEGLPQLELAGLGIVIWLAVMNTALGYWLYNRALRVLTAFEMNVLLNAIPLATALLAWLWPGDSLSARQWAGLVTAAAGILLVQWPGKRAGGWRIC